MNDKSLIVVVVFFALSFMTWFFSSNLNPFKQTPESIIEFVFTEHHFDTLQYQENAFVYFKFKNIGNAPLVIENVDPTCGCTVASYPTRTIYPDETDSILMTYDTTIRGYFSKGTMIYSNSSTSPDKLKITGFVPFND